MTILAALKSMSNHLSVEWRAMVIFLLKKREQ